ncbi:NAD(P)H-dependent oxidoreductase [Streptomyces sp. NPDC005438]|uniref:NADPH-dependent FMN reductase n=1 Tax=Streptomyces sp. NPDC005438 TaxID=3156880 RepID=UPI0033B4F364
MSSTSPVRVAVIVASTREGRFAPVIQNWFTQQLDNRDDIEYDLVDLASQPDHATFSRTLAQADGFVVVTPEYNHGFPGPLKVALDSFGSEWHAKPVGFVSYGGHGGGLRAVEQLRQVFAELHTVTVRDQVSFHMAWERFDGQGQPSDATVQEGAAKGLLDQLVWWGRALRTARTEHPYGS